MGDTFKSAWNGATDAAKSAAAAVAHGIDAIDDAGNKLGQWIADQTVRATNALVAGEIAAANALVATEKAVGNAAVAAAEAIGHGVDVVLGGVKWLAQGVWESFTGGPKGFVCIPCAFKGIVYRHDFSDVHGQQLLICTGPDRQQTIQQVTRNPNGTYKVVGTVKDGDPKWTVTPVTGGADVPAPTVSHVNGIQNTPHEGLSGALELQKQLHSKCENRSPATKACPGCDCVLYTYSEFMGVLTDLVQCLAAKLGWNGKVTDEEAQMMRDAVKSGKRLTLSAHSRGSILTENAWDKVYYELRDQHMNDPQVKAAGQKAFDDTLKLTNDPFAATAAGNYAQRQAAGDEAAATLNKNVTVISSGNAVSEYNPREEGVRVVSMQDGKSIDFVNRTTGSIEGGKMITVPHMVKERGFMNHNFNENYAEDVADRVCGGGYHYRLKPSTPSTPSTPR